MTIHLMRNTEDGDVRVRDELARKIDITPNRYTTRAGFVHWIVRTLYLEAMGTPWSTRTLGPVSSGT